MMTTFRSVKTVVLDSSVVINLNATGRAAEILKALEVNVEVSEQVRDELELGKTHGYDDGNKLQELIEREVIDIVELSTDELTIFRECVTGEPGRSLDDGEASTIARAVGSGAAAAIDDRKAIKLCDRSFHSVQVVSTAEILLHGSVITRLGQRDVTEAVFDALAKTRMYVPPKLVNRVISLIGVKRAAVCSSLRGGVTRHQ